MSGPSVPTEAAPPWYLTAEQINNSPSQQYFVRKYGSVEKARSREQESRLTTCAFLQESGQKLRLPQLSIATAIVFYHRFYARESYEVYERFQVATTCLFLASKVEETPKKLKDVIIEAYKVQHNTVQPPDPDSQELWKLKEQILICERELLRVLGFDLSVEHAYRPVRRRSSRVDRAMRCGLARLDWPRSPQPEARSLFHPLPLVLAPRDSCSPTSRASPGRAISRKSRGTLSTTRCAPPFAFSTRRGAWPPQR